MTAARKAAERDIKEELRRHSRCFLSFRKTLNPIMDKIVTDYIKAQEKTDGKA